MLKRKRKKIFKNIDIKKYYYLISFRSIALKNDKVITLGHKYIFQLKVSVAKML